MVFLECAIYFINGSDHEVVASYLELYEEGEVEHIVAVQRENWPNTIDM